MVANINRINPSIEVLALSLDMSKEKSIAEAFATVAERFPEGVDVLVSNAVSKIATEQSIVDIDMNNWWDKDLTTNIRGSTLLTKYFLTLPTTSPERPVKRKIVYLSSGVAYIVNPGNTAYSFSKLVINQLATYAHAESTRDLKVQAAAVHPGIFVTDILEDMYTFYAVDTNELAGGVINWLTSDEAAFMSGRYTTANVGFSFHPFNWII